MIIQAIPLIMGAILVIAGIAQVFVQMRRDWDVARGRGIEQGAQVNRSGFKVQSAYPGMVMIGVGALLLLAQTFFGK
jgi:hypothetical protein